MSKSFGALRAIRDLSFSLGSGEILGIAGPNGSGKSTLFNILTRIPFGPDRGEMSLDGQSLDRSSPRQIVQAGLARTFQTETDFETLTVLENLLVSMPDGDFRDGRQAAETHAMELLASVDLQGQGDRIASEITVYDRKKLMIATALASRPKVLLLDEPAAGLSRPEVAEMIELIRRINAGGVSIVVIEHIISLLVSVSNRLLVLNFGEMLCEGTPQDVIRDRRVIEAYLGSAAAHV
ncbi:ATP-binding cassette domain-containing protein [Aquamicrobium sp. NLF2-7]|uniref:ABC transporter ATP-binding protein n=1 Tax=Aquamicrobium sp. NLF2-7 TaxID=2918753 RepID=UPI001EFC21D7|nr:ATP-binding cassette domain-containing protein [Aquamicrobium sp. NLF2-7]MCG8274575.1 ATP-binding cassette domain-containing protein [Aquamicrobium sp. NLF2-7]